VSTSGPELKDYDCGNPMRVAFVIPDDISVVLFAQNILKNLRDLPGAKVTVICSLDQYRREVEEVGVTALHIDMYRFFNPLKDLRYLLKLYLLLKRGRFNIVFNFSTKPNIYGSIAAWLAGVNQVISHVVGLGAACASGTGFFATLLQEVFLGLYRIACRLSDKVWFTNPNDLKLFLSRSIITPEKSVLTRNYLNTNDYSLAAVNPTQVEALKKELGVAAGDRIVVMVARMIWPKGIREFAEAAVLLRAQYPHVRFLLIAPLEEGSSDAVPESFIREMEKRANLRWLGFRSDVRELYAIADLAVLPSYYQEGGYPRALLEPMSMGKPLIATLSEDVRGPVDEGRNGYLVPIKDSCALAGSIATIINDDDLRKRMGSHSYQKARNEFEECHIIPQALAACGLRVAAE
jgi:N,N'-diacetylbacillosaminyl-diphospho-undecaprenol alpha-1,3-N-acetylgalactosaminyltransferase